MANLHDTLMRRVGKPLLMRGLGERDGNGEFKTFSYRVPGVAGDADPLKFTGISSAVRSIEQPDFDGGGVVRRDTKTWEIPREQLDAKGITFPQRKARIDDFDCKEPFDWLVDVSQCVWGAVFVSLALIREPRTAGNEIRRANV